MEAKNGDLRYYGGKNRGGFAMKRGIWAIGLIVLDWAGCQTAPVYEAQSSPRSPG